MSAHERNVGSSIDNHLTGGMGLLGVRLDGKAVGCIVGHPPLDVSQFGEHDGGPVPVGGIRFGVIGRRGR